MRYPAKETAAKHDRIVKEASRLFRERGFENVTVGEVMKAAGLTSGALYGNFKNKDDLCMQAICVALDGIVDRYRGILRERGRVGLKLIVDEYLSEAHRGGVAAGCTFAALGADMARASAAAKRAYELRIQALIDVFTEALQQGAEKERRAKAQHILSAMLGAITFARSMRDPEAASELLSQVRTSLHRELD